MTTKVTKAETLAKGPTTVEALVTVLKEYSQTLVDAEGYPVKVLRVALVEEKGAVVARSIGSYALPSAAERDIEAKANKAHKLRKIGL